MLFALFVGFFGMVLLVIRPEVLDGSKVGSTGAMVVLIGGFSWAVGTVLVRRMPLPSSPFLSSGMQMIGGGGLLLVAGFVSGQANNFRLSNISSSSAIAMLFLTLIGSLVGFTCYVWLLGVSTPTRVATYAYVNPIIALLLGWSLGGEHPSTLSLVASGVVILSVATVISSKRPSTQDETVASSVNFNPLFAADEP